MILSEREWDFKGGCKRNQPAFPLRAPRRLAPLIVMLCQSSGGAVCRLASPRSRSNSIAAKLRLAVRNRLQRQEQPGH